MTEIVHCGGVSKSYARTRPLGIKEAVVGRYRRARSERFSREWALRDVTFTVAPGQAFGVVGGNGSGKSTLLGLLLGVLRPDAGSVGVRGRVAALLALGAGFHPELTGRQNVFLYGAILGMRMAEIRAQFDRIVEFSEIADAIDQPLRTYSSGMITRLGFSTVIHAPADLLLIDEVLAVGDLEFQTKCRDFFQGYKGTLVLVSHDLTAVESLCNEGIWLNEGRIAQRGPMTSVVEAYRQSVRSAMPTAVTTRT